MGGEVILRTHVNLDLEQQNMRRHTMPSGNNSPHRKPKLDSLKQSALDKEKEKERKKESLKSGTNPSFVFLQLYHSAQCEPTAEKPLLISSSDHIKRAMKVILLSNTIVHLFVSVYYLYLIVAADIDLCFIVF